MPGPVVGAAVLHYRRGAAAADTVRALQASDLPPDHLLLVDNASADGSFDALLAEVDGVMLLRRTSNDGYATAMREAVGTLRAAGCEVVVLLTHECLPAVDAVRLLVGALQDPDLALVGPVLTDAATGAVWSSGGVVDTRSWTPLNRTDPPDVEVADCDWLDGACLAGRVAELDDDRLWDGRYFLYLEDAHLGLALRERGRRVAVVVAATATQTSGGMPVYYGSRNRLLLARRFASRAGLLRRIGFDVLAGGASLVRHQRRHWLRPQLQGVADGLRGRGGPPPPGVDASMPATYR